MNRFWKWFIKKDTIQKDKERPFFAEREVWFASLGNNIGHEQDGKGEEFYRPIIILKKFNKEILWAIPLTSRSKTGTYYHAVEIRNRGTSTLILSQLKLIDAKRLNYKIDTIGLKEFDTIKQKIRSLLS